MLMCAIIEIIAQKRRAKHITILLRFRFGIGKGSQQTILNMKN